MRLLLAFVGAAALALVGGILWRVTLPTREWRELRSYSGRLLGLEDQNRISALLHESPPKYVVGFYSIDWVQAVEDAHHERRVVAVEIGFPRRGYCPLDVTVLDREFHKVRETRLDPGHGTKVAEMKPFSRDGLSAWAFIVRTEPDVQYYNAPSEGTVQYYDLVDEAPRLIRIEDRKGRLRRNGYRDPVQTLGAGLPVRDGREWEAALHSPDYRDVLPALIWLGGVHRSPVPLPKWEYLESEEATRLFAHTLARPGVQQQLQVLAASPDPWIAEAASAALNPEKER